MTEESAKTSEIDLLVKHIKECRDKVSSRLYDDDFPGHWSEPDGHCDCYFIPDDTEEYRIISAQIEIYDALLEEIAKIYGWDYTILVARYDTISPETGLVFDTEVLKNKLGNYQYTMKAKFDLLLDPV